MICDSSIPYKVVVDFAYKTDNAGVRG